MRQAPGRRASKRTRNRLYYEQAGHCGLCGCWVPKAVSTFEHIIPRAKGGPATWGNGMMTCKSCNNAKADSILPDIRPSLRRYAIAS